MNIRISGTRINNKLSTKEIIKKYNLDTTGLDSEEVESYLNGGELELQQQVRIATTIENNMHRGACVGSEPWRCAMDKLQDACAEARA